MGKLLLGPIQSRTPYFIPGPEGLASILEMTAKTGAMGYSSMLRRSGRTSDDDDKRLKGLPGHQQALYQQQQMLDIAEQNLKYEAVDALQNKYGNDIRAFLQNESIENGGLLAKKEQLLTLRNQWKNNTYQAEEYQKKYDKAYDAMVNNNASDRYAVDSSNPDTRLSYKDDDGNIHYYTNAQYMDLLSSGLGVDKNGNLQVSSIPDIIKGGDFDKYIREASKDAAAGMKERLIDAGNSVTSNNESLSKVANLVLGNMPNMPIDVKKDMNQEYWNWRSKSNFDDNKLVEYLKDQNITPDTPVDKMTASQKEQWKKVMWLHGQVDNTTGIFKKYSISIDKNGTGSGGNGSGSDKPLGPISGFISGRQKGQKRSPVYTLGKGGMMRTANYNTLNESLPIGPQYTSKVNADLHERLIYGNPMKADIFDNGNGYWFTPDGIPNDMSLLSRSGAVIMGMTGYLSEMPIPYKDASFGDEGRWMPYGEEAHNTQLMRAYNNKQITAEQYLSMKRSWPKGKDKEPGSNERVMTIEYTLGVPEDDESAVRLLKDKLWGYNARNGGKFEKGAVELKDVKLYDPTSKKTVTYKTWKAALPVTLDNMYWDDNYFNSANVKNAQDNMTYERQSAFGVPSK